MSRQKASLISSAVAFFGSICNKMISLLESLILSHHSQEAVGQALVGCLRAPGHVEDGTVLVSPDQFLLGLVHGIQDGLGGLTLIRDLRAVHIQIQLTNKYIFVNKTQSSHLTLPALLVPPHVLPALALAGVALHGQVLVADQVHVELLTLPRLAWIFIILD